MTARLENALKRLPPEAVEQVADFAESLAQRQRAARPSDRRLKLDWAGGLSDLKDRYTSVELQHKAGEWRDEEAPH